MVNRIDDLVKTTDKKQLNKKLLKLSEIAKNKAEKQKLEIEFFDSLERNIGKKITSLQKEVELKIKMKELSEIVSLSYIARVYFGKTKGWLYHRINGNVINGKRASLSYEQKQHLANALKDISKKIGSMSVS